MARVNVPGVARCTAVFVAAHWAVTAAHCLGAKQLGHPAPASAVHVLLGYVDGRFSRHLQPDAVRVDAGVAAEPEVHRGSDVALLHFAEAVTDVLPVAPGVVAAGTRLALGGYGQDRAERLLVDADCAAEGMATDGDGRPLLVHGCNGTRGTSGGAVLAEFDGAWRLVGVQVGAFTDRAGGVAVPGGRVAAMLAGVGAD